MAISLNLAETSLKGRVTRGLLIPVIVLLLLASIGVGSMVQWQMRRVFDAKLLFQAQSLANNVEQEVEAIEMEASPGLMFNYARKENADYFVLRSVSGETILASPSLGEALLLQAPSELGKPLFRSIQLPDGRAGRLVSVAFAPRVEVESDDENSDGASDVSAGVGQANGAVQIEGLNQVGSPVVISVATSDRPYLDLVWRTWLILGGVFAALLIAIAALLQRSLRLGLEPLTDIRHQIRSLDATSLNQRIRPTQEVDELDDIVDQTNEMLSRLETTFERERQFSRDAAHELRTPLAELRNLAEVGSKWPTDQALSTRFYADAIAASAQMEQTLSNLLSLARAERDLEGIEPGQFDMVVLVQEIWARVCASANADSNRLIFDAPAKFSVSAGRHQWALIFQNLLSNAVFHGNQDCDITVTINPSDVLLVTNKADDLRPADLAQIFDRLWRKEAARSQQHHSGLGLSLVRAYARQLGLDVSASLDKGNSLSIRFSGLAAFTANARVLPEKDLQNQRSFSPNPRIAFSRSGSRCQRGQ